jgi:hypothetical protein
MYVSFLPTLLHLLLFPCSHEMSFLLYFHRVFYCTVLTINVQNMFSVFKEFPFLYLILYSQFQNFFLSDLRIINFSNWTHCSLSLSFLFRWFLFKWMSHCISPSCISILECLRYSSYSLSRCMSFDQVGFFFLPSFLSLSLSLFNTVLLCPFFIHFSTVLHSHFYVLHNIHSFSSVSYFNRCITHPVCVWTLLSSHSPGWQSPCLLPYPCTCHDV